MPAQTKQNWLIFLTKTMHAMPINIIMDYQIQVEAITKDQKYTQKAIKKISTKGIPIRNYTLKADHDSNLFVRL